MCERPPGSIHVLRPVQVRRSSIVYDPFVGTGSILVAAAHLGAITLGADIDIRVLRDGKQDPSGNVRLSSLCDVRFPVFFSEESLCGAYGYVKSSMLGSDMSSGSLWYGRCGTIGLILRLID